MIDCQAGRSRSFALAERSDAFMAEAFDLVGALSQDDIDNMADAEHLIGITHSLQHQARRDRAVDNRLRMKAEITLAAFVDGLAEIGE